MVFLNMQSEKIPLHINVHPVVHEFFLSRYHSNTIELSPNDLFSERIKTILQLQPKKYKKVPFKITETLILLLPNKFYIGEDNYVNTRYRNYLDDRRQYLLSRELYKLFKEVFCKYVLAFCRGNNLKRGSQKKGIEDFCLVYDIEFNSINYDMLKKTWDRSFEKQFLQKY